MVVLDCIEDTDQGFIDEISVAYGHASQYIGLPSTTPDLAPNRAFFQYSSMFELRGGDPKFNAAALRDLLMGENSAYREAVLINAAGALIVAGVADDWKPAYEEAAEAIDKGLAKALLDCWLAF